MKYVIYSVSHQAWISYPKGHELTAHHENAQRFTREEAEHALKSLGPGYEMQPVGS